MISLAGKSIVVTGASSGIGRAAALAFADRHARLTLCSRNRAALEMRGKVSCTLLDQRPMSPLMMDFVATLAGREHTVTWAQQVLAGDATEAAKQKIQLLQILPWP